MKYQNFTHKEINPLSFWKRGGLNLTEEIKTNIRRTVHDTTSQKCQVCSHTTPCTVLSTYTTSLGRGRADTVGVNLGKGNTLLGAYPLGNPPILNLCSLLYGQNTRE